MDTQKKLKNTLKESKVSLELKLAALWAALMFIYIYVDYFHLYMPGKIDNIRGGRIFVFDITQGFLMAALVSMMVPALMIFLSVALPAKGNRLVNMIVAAVYIPYTLFNLAGETPWMHMVFAAVAEVALLCLVIFYVWKWPRL